MCTILAQRCSIKCKLQQKTEVLNLYGLRKNLGLGFWFSYCDNTIITLKKCSNDVSKQQIETVEKN